MSMEWARFCAKTGVDPNDKESMRVWNRHEPRINKDGTPKYITQQSDKDAADINKIIKKFDAKGILNLKNQVKIDEEKLIDVTVASFQEAQFTIGRVMTEWEDLPSDIKKKFKNDPKNYIQFLAKDTPANEQIDEIVEGYRDQDKIDKENKESGPKTEPSE